MSDNQAQDPGTVGQDQPVPADHPEAPRDDQQPAQPEAVSTDQEANAVREPEGGQDAPADGASPTSSDGQANDPVHNDQGPAAPQLHPELHQQGSGEE